MKLNELADIIADTIEEKGALNIIISQIAIYYKIPRWQLKDRKISELMDAYKDILYDVHITNKLKEKTDSVGEE